MKDNIPPEEKLLRLIRGPKKQDIAGKKKFTATNKNQKTVIKESIHSSLKKYLSFLYIHRIIWMVFMASCVYLAISFIYPLVGLRKIELPELKPRKITESKIEPKLQVRPYEFYLEGIRNRQIFNSPTIQETERPASNVDVDLTKDLNLVGIISGEKLQAVIEDKKNQKTYYLNKGQFIGEFQVEDIQEGKIILNYKGQRYELYL